MLYYKYFIHILLKFSLKKYVFVQKVENVSMTLTTDIPAQINQ